MQTKCGFEPLMHIVEPRIPNVHTFSLSLCAEFCLHTCSNLIFLFFLIIKLTCDLSDAKMVEDHDASLCPSPSF